MAYLDNEGVESLWAKAKSKFGVTLARTGVTIRLMSGDGAIIGSSTLPYATTSANGVIKRSDIGYAIRRDGGEIYLVDSDGNKIANSGITDDFANADDVMTAEQIRNLVK